MTETNLRHKLSAIIIDDEQGAINVLSKLLERIGDVEVLATEKNPNLGLRHIMVMAPDIIFLDIQMEKKNGIALLQEVKELSPQSHIVIVSGYDDYTYEAFKYGASDYLVKPIVMEELEASLFRISQALGEAASSSKTSDEELSLLEKDVKIRLARDKGSLVASDIVYLKASGSYSELFLRGNEKEICTRGLWLLERELPDFFFRIHRSIVINTKMLMSVSSEDNTCTLCSDTHQYVLPVSKANIEALNEYLQAYD